MGKQIWMGQFSAALALGGLLAGCNSARLDYIEAPPSQTPCEPGVDCEPAPGHLEGQLCDRSAGTWMAGVSIELTGPSGVETRLTDEAGFFRFSPLPPGDYSLQVPASPERSPLHARVYPGRTSRVGDPQCKSPLGALEGRLCGPDGRWLEDARLTLLDPLTPLETRTNLEGFFRLEEVPPGEHLLEVQRGSYSTQFSATVLEGELTLLPEPVCIPPTTSMAVVTGIYDEIQRVLEIHGYQFRAHFTDYLPGVVYPLSSEGSIDLINGASSSYWLREFLSDLLWMQSYPIILLNCGLADSSLTNHPEMARVAAQNLREYVHSGGALYASDWATEIVRLAFPDRIAFLGDADSFGSSRTGVEHPRQRVFIPDEGLARNLGSSSAFINLNLPLWSVMMPRHLQPEGLTVLVEGTIFHYPSQHNPGGAQSVELAGSPLIASFKHGEGRVMVTSAHLEGQTTEDLQNILSYIVFEL